MHASAEPMWADPVVEMIAEGRHREAVAELARTQGRALGRFCMALLGSQAEAEETAQEVLLTAHRSLDSFRGEGSIRGWLFTIARRKCARRLETRGRRQRRLENVHDAPADPATPETVLEARRRAQRVRAALDHLKPSEREAVVLRYEAGLAYREIAALCAVDEAAARKRVSRALARLRDLLRAAR